MKLDRIRNKFRKRQLGQKTLVLVLVGTLVPERWLALFRPNEGQKEINTKYRVINGSC